MQPVILLNNIQVALGENFRLKVESLGLKPGLIYAHESSDRRPARTRPCPRDRR